MLILRVARGRMDRPCQQWRIALLAGIVLVGWTGAARAQPVPFQPSPFTPAPFQSLARPLTPAIVAGACRTENARFCPLQKGGTRADIACLQQHHINLRLSCRNVLARSKLPATPVTNTPNIRRGLP